jgi:serine/threonine-protein kinase RsbW
MSYLAPVVEYVRELARGVGFSDREIHFIHLGVEEAVTNIIRHGYQGNPDAVFEIVCEQTVAGLTFRIREKGIPFDVAKLSEYSPRIEDSGPSLTGLGSYLMKQAMDEVCFHNLGRDGKEIRLTKYLAGNPDQDRLEEAGGISADATTEEGKAPKIGAGFTVRSLAAEEAVEVSRCAYRTYGYTYDEYIYYPERIRDLMGSGLLCSGVAVTDDGQIVGHVAIKRRHPEDVIAEIGVFFITPEFRGSSAFLRLCKFMKQKIESLGLCGIFARSVSKHTITQRGASFFGLSDCGLLIGAPPEKLDLSDLTTRPHQVSTRVLAYRSLGVPRERVIHPPEELRDRILGLYGNLNIPIIVGEKEKHAGRPQDLETQLASTRMATSNVADIEVFEHGEDSLEAVHQQFRKHRLEGAAVVFVHLNLEDPQTAALASALLSEGFLFAGVLPHELRGRDALILQYLNNLKVSYDCIQLNSSTAKELLAYVRAHDPYLL